MTADDRLNQLEPLLSEAMTILDRHTAQLKQLHVAVGQIGTSMVQQGDNISFLLREQVEIKTQVYGLKINLDVVRNQLAEVAVEQTGMKTELSEVKTELGEVKTELGEVKNSVSDVKAGLSEVKTEQTSMKNQQAEMNGKLDQLLQLLQKQSK